MSKSFCIYCGAEKGSFDKACPICNRVPISSEDIAKSLIICTDFQLDAANLPLEEGELRGLLAKIKLGDADAFDLRQVQVVATYHRKYLRNPRAALRGALFFFGPVIIGIAFLIWYFPASEVATRWI